MSVELSERGDYEGGELEIVPDTGRPARGPCRAAAPSFFPSRALHRVTPVTRGDALGAGRLDGARLSVMA